MAKTTMTLDNTARVDQSVRAGKVWKSPASSKPTYIVKVTTDSSGGEEHVPLEGTFRVLDAWYLKVTGAGNAGDTISVSKGQPSGSGNPIWTHTVGGGGTAPDDIVRADTMDRAEVGGVGDLGDNGAATTGLWVAANPAGGGDTAAVVCVMVELEA